MQIGSCNVRRIVITAIALVVAGLTASTALANSPHFKKGREPSCRNAGAAISKSAACKAVFAGLAVQASVPDNGTPRCRTTSSGSARTSRTSRGSVASARKPNGPSRTSPCKPAFPTTATPRCRTTSSGSARTSRTSRGSVASARKPNRGETHLKRGHHRAPSPGMPPGNGRPNSNQPLRDTAIRVIRARRDSKLRGVRVPLPASRLMQALWGA